MKIRHINWEWNEHRGYYEGVIYGPGGVDWSIAVIFQDENNGDWHLNYENKDPSENILKAKTFEETVQKAYLFHKQNVMDSFFEVAM